MEQHPVPQNVTTFQFRLIGDMTIKQFGYLAGGAILAYISYILPLPFFFTWPLTVMFALFGIGFAFVPIEERPMDVWVLSFLKSVYTPTQFVWHRTHQQPEPQESSPTTTTQLPPTAVRTAPVITNMSQQPTTPTPISTTIQGIYTQPAPVRKQTWFDEFFSWIDTLLSTNKPRVVTTPRPFPNKTPQVVPTPIQQVPNVTPPEKNPELDALQQKVAALQTELDTKAHAETRVFELQKEMTEIIKQKQEVEERLLAMKKQSTQQTVSTQPTKPVVTVTPSKPSTPTVKIIAPDAAARAGLPRLTTFSNVVTGIVKDNQGGLLPGVLVTVKDKEGIPLRALKTNKIGQFAASTQLPNGVYLVEVEDPRERYVFDRAQITLNGSVLPAIEIAAKSKRDINRETLAKQIFGQTSNT